MAAVKDVGGAPGHVLAWRCPDLLQRRKSLESILEESAHDHANEGAKLTLTDLLCIGIGSTIGSGVFVLTGDALPEAGPSAVLSWLAAGLICILSASSYMELSARLPTKGSCYVFSYHSLGELAAVIGAVCLTMEYGISGAGVARNWSAKLANTMGLRLVYCYNGGAWGEGCNDDEDFYIDPVAGIMCLLCTWVTAKGLDLGKLIINAFTVAKLLLVAFMIVAGLSCWTGNIFESAESFAPSGVAGTIKTTSMLFFGFVGFDEVCCMASKAENPSKTMPRAIGGTLLGAAVLSALAQLALAVMVPYSAGMASVPFALAFEHHGLPWARWIVSIGELVLLPLVVFLAMLPQPEVTAAMSVDGLLPSIFRRENARGTFVQGAWICGGAVTVVAVVVPFAMLWDIISLGVLFSFNLTNASLINLRYGNGGALRQPWVDCLVWVLMACMAVAGFTCNRGIVMPLLAGEAVLVDSALAFALAFASALVVLLAIRFGFCEQCDAVETGVFKAWGVPFCPGVAMFFNSFLLATLAWVDWGYFAVLVFIFLCLYLAQLGASSRAAGRAEAKAAASGAIDHGSTSVEADGPPALTPDKAHASV